MARNLLKVHLRKLREDRRLGREVDAETQRNKVHQNFMPDIEPFRARVGTELRKALDQVVVKGTTQLRPAQDHLLPADSTPIVWLPHLDPPAVLVIAAPETFTAARPAGTLARVLTRR